MYGDDVGIAEEAAFLPVVLLLNFILGTGEICEGVISDLVKDGFTLKLTLAFPSLEARVPADGSVLSLVHFQLPVHCKQGNLHP